MRGKHNNPRRSGGHSRFLNCVSLGVWGIAVHGANLLAFLLYPFKVLALDVYRVIRITGGRFVHMAFDHFARLAVADGDILLGHIAAPVIPLEVGRIELARQEARRGVDRFERHTPPLLMRGLVGTAVVAVLRVMRIVPGTVSAQFVGMVFYAVMILTAMLGADGAFLTLHGVGHMGVVGAQMAFLGMGVQVLVMALHLVDVFAQNFPVRAIGKRLGSDHHGGFCHGRVTGGLETADADSLVVLDFENLGDSLNVIYLCSRVAPGNGHFQPPYGANLMIHPPLGGASA